MNVIVTTSLGGNFVLKNAFALGQDHIGHDRGIYEICEGDTFKSVVTK